MPSILDNVSSKLSSLITTLASSIMDSVSGSGDSNYEDLKKKYSNFSHPMAQIKLGPEVFNSDAAGVVINEIRVELSAGFEASAASFRIYDVYDEVSGKFNYKNLEKAITIGNSVAISLGYMAKLETVFIGFITGISFGFEPGKLPYIEVEAMDVKALMMGNCYAASLKATSYSAAVKEVLARTAGGQLTNLGGITKMEITDTPDLKDAAGQPAPVDMVSESDYEFVVRAAKRYNYEFFVDRGNVLFRPAKDNNALLIKLGSSKGMTSFRISYSITGLVGNVEARTIDADKGQLIAAKGSIGSLSSVGKAQQLVGSGSKVYLDPSITSQQEAEARVKSMLEKVSYRLGSLEADCVGIPELVPGRFIAVEGLGAPADNNFYLTTVIHEITSEHGYVTQIKGCSAKM